ncbi:MAG: hypothetical protein OEX09_06255, partial [Candidatus Bathyarchaeota archaeon]|nr:hypothetical protein [Candidatus Bathyarchaeota archaeon]
MPNSIENPASQYLSGALAGETESRCKIRIRAEMNVSGECLKARNELSAQETQSGGETSHVQS